MITTINTMSLRSHPKLAEFHEIVIDIRYLPLASLCSGVCVKHSQFIAIAEFEEFWQVAK